MLPTHQVGRTIQHWPGSVCLPPECQGVTWWKNATGVIIAGKSPVNMFIHRKINYQWGILKQAVFDYRVSTGLLEQQNDIGVEATIASGTVSDWGTSQLWMERYGMFIELMVMFNSQIQLLEVIVISGSMADLASQRGSLVFVPLGMDGVIRMIVTLDTDSAREKHAQ